MINYNLCKQLEIDCCFELKYFQSAKYNYRMLRGLLAIAKWITYGQHSIENISEALLLTTTSISWLHS